MKTAPPPTSNSSDIVKITKKISYRGIYRQANFFLIGDFLTRDLF